MCKKNSLQKKKKIKKKKKKKKIEEAIMGRVRETPQKNKSSTGWVRKTFSHIFPGPSSTQLFS